MHSAGLAAFAARTATKTGVYSFEQHPEAFPATLERSFRAKKQAWEFWAALPPGYRRTIIWWVISAKQDTTRQRRLAHLIAESAAGRRLKWVVCRVHATFPVSRPSHEAVPGFDSPRPRKSPSSRA
jgi:uncharacterized protein YdeI (YjbR/CyaY-like superfamily)